MTFGKDDETVPSLGFLAQELADVVPEAVTVPANPANELYKVSYTTLIPVLTKAIQEQQATIEKQQAEITALKAQAAEVAEMKTAMADMRAELSKVVLKKVAGKSVAKK